jgi:hypothetical protein
MQTYRRNAYRGLDLRWDMQGPQEKEDELRWRRLMPDASVLTSVLQMELIVHG